MIRPVAIIFLCSLLALGISHNDGRQRNKCQGTATPNNNGCNVCQPRGRARDVTLRVRNVLREPFFEEVVKINCTRYETLFYIMQQAAEANSMFKFQTTYFKGLGFFVDAINNVRGTYNVDQSYWEILNSSLLQTSVGVSSYIPSPNEVITFNLTVGGH